MSAQQTVITPVAPAQEAAPIEGVQPKVEGQEAPKPAEAQPAAPTPGEEAKRFAVLARREKAIQKQQAEIKAAKDALEAERAKAGKGLDLDGLKKRFSDNPFQVIQELGGSFEQLVDHAQKDASGVDPLKALKAEWEAFKKQEADAKKAQEEAQQRQRQDAEATAIANFKDSIKQHLLTNKDNYELTHLYDAQDVVFAVIELHYKDTAKQGSPRIMSIKEAADLVENDLLERSKKALQSKKLSPQPQGQTDETGEPQPSPKAKPQGDSKTATQPPTRTIDNQLIGQSVPASAVPSEKDRIRRALEALSKAS